MRDSCGTGGQVRHLRVKRTNVAHRLPRGKRAPERKSTPTRTTTKPLQTYKSILEKQHHMFFV
ncbi:hypothetical protein [Fictibacillus sp. UD]|uniref:hypothetical protein n=1 Tax=Fictibacillus sp. UD TaxID=3038777 RepID=UPI003748D959